VKVAVIGSGAAAAGVLAGLERFAPPGVEITLFDIGERLEEAPPDVARDGYSRAALAPIYHRLHAEHGLTFPPPKSHFGQSLTKLTVEDKPLLWKSEHRGGLTNVWGGGMFPFTDRELAGWPVNAADMDPYYRIMAEEVGVCGEPDALGGYFTRDYVNRPPLRTSRVIEALRDTTNRHGRSAAGYRLVAGASRLALETRREHARACVYSGECMLGCPRESIWSASQALDRYQARGFIARTVRARVLRAGDGQVHFRPVGGAGTTVEHAGGFDRVYVAAGCIGSTEIAMRSLGLTRGPVMLDNAVLSFPIFYLGVGSTGRSDGEPGYFSLCNLSMMGVPDDPAEAAAQVSVYPAFDHLWRYYTPEPLWKAMEPLWREGRWRFLLGRVFLAGAANRTLSFKLVDDALAIARGPAPDSRADVRRFMRSLRRATNHAGFFVPPVTPGGHGTSSHYAATLPYGGRLVNVPRHGRIAPGVHLADAATFPTSPAISPTFTIMANACRTVYESLQD
jgi:choline dehydrogenase-like flavoprotein